METSLTNYRQRYRDLALEFLWRQWSAIGVAGHTSARDSRLIDPEALLLVTTTFGRHDPRLFDEVLDWLDTNGRLVNLQRLQNLGEIIGDRSVLDAIAARVGNRSVNSKWRSLSREEGGSTGPRRLFHDLPVMGEPDETFARHGWLRGAVKLRQLSQSPDPNLPENFLFKLRALFGMQARAEIMAFLLAHESGHPGDMAGRIAYFPRTVQTTLNDMEHSGHMLSRRDGREKRFWLRRSEWRFLMTWCGPDTAQPVFPSWVDWAPLFASMEALWRFLEKPGLDVTPPAVQSIELRACVERLSPDFVREHVKTPPTATGSEYVRSVLEDFCRVLA